MTAPKFKKKFKPAGLYGFIIGALAMVCFFFLFRGCQEKNSTNYLSTTTRHTKVDTVRAGNYTLHIKEKDEIEVKEQNAVIDEKFSSLNNRFSDMYVFLSIIVTLLLVGLASVYWRTRNEVAVYMEENFNDYRDEIADASAKAQNIVSEMQTQLDLASRIGPRTPPPSPPTSDPNQEQNPNPNDDNGHQ